jgi:hypothetical protein
LPTLGIIYVLKKHYDWHIIMVLMYISLMVYDIWHIDIWFLAIFSFMRYSIPLFQWTFKKSPSYALERVP